MTDRPDPHPWRRVAASDGAESADRTLSTVGDAVFSGAKKLRDVILDVHVQRLDPAHGGGQA